MRGLKEYDCLSILVKNRVSILTIVASCMLLYSSLEFGTFFR